MAHLVSTLSEENPGNSLLQRIKKNIPSGKLGISFFVGFKEIFLGIQINNVMIEETVRRQYIPLNKADVKVFKFDPMG
jgi:hypothetical protein